MDTAGIATVVVLVLVAAFLSATETVLARLGLVRALRLDEEDEPGAARLLWLLEHRASALNAVLLATVTVRLAAAAVATLLGIRWLPTLPGVVAAVGSLLLLSLLAGEVAPRTLALRHLEATGLRVAAPAVVMVRLLTPIATVVVDLGKLLVRTRRDVSGPYPSDEELGELLAADEDEEHHLEEVERAMIHSIFELGDTIVREIMIPRPDMITVDEAAPMRDLVNTIIEHGHSRIPVYRDNKDEIVGVVYAKDVLKRLALQPGRERWRDLIRPPSFVPETKRVDDLLRDLQEQAVHLGIVVDEYGALAGLVTIEDILEEIVGEIVDEHDREEPLVEVLDEGRLLVDARLSVDDLNELLGTELPDEGWDTVGGLVVGILGRVPEHGEAVDIEGLSLSVVRVQGRRVAKVIVVPREPSEDAVETGETVRSDG